MKAGKVLKPRCLRRGSRVLLVAPGFHFLEEKFVRGKTFFEQTFHVEAVEATHLRGREMFFPATDAERMQDVLTGLLDPSIDALLGVRGGYGCARFYLDLRKELKRAEAALKRKGKALTPKIVAGYSDMTILINGLYQDFNWVSFHTPMIAGRPFDEPLAFELKTLERSLFSNLPLGSIPRKLADVSLESVVPGKAKAPVVGGNLSVVASSLGTAYELNTKGHILFLEDIGEAPFRVDRMLHQLLHAGLFNGVKGVILGDFTSCEPHSDLYADVSVTQVLRRFFRETFHKKNVPVVAGFPAGHGQRQISFPIGVPVKLEVPLDPKGTPCVQFDEAGAKASRY